MVSMVTYRGTCDVYAKWIVYEPDGGGLDKGYDYDNPETIRCNVAELNPDNVQEIFGNSEYKYTKTIKIETDVPLLLSSRIGNIQMNEPVFEDMIFNIDNVQPRLDWSGKVVGYRIICRSTVV